MQRLFGRGPVLAGVRRPEEARDETVLLLDFGFIRLLIRQTSSMLPDEVAVA